MLLGGEYPAVVEYAPYQAVPKKKVKKDPKIGTILEGVYVFLTFLKHVCKSFLHYHRDLQNFKKCQCLKKLQNTCLTLYC